MSVTFAAVALIALGACRKQAVLMPMPPGPKWEPNRESLLAHPPGGMRFIKGGTFRMGGLDGAYDSLAEAKHIADSGMMVGDSPQLPSHPVIVGDFFMDTSEVTEQEWKALMGKAPGGSRGGAYPIASATWYQAVLFANAKSRRDRLRPVYSYSGFEINESRYGNGVIEQDTSLTGLVIDMTANGYRLPTEAEYEYAARAGGETDPPRSIDTLTRVAASDPPNPWGLHDLLGNVQEWLNDGYNERYYTTTILDNPFGDDDAREGGIALMPAGVPEPGIFPARSVFRAVRGPVVENHILMTGSPKTRQYKSPTEHAGFRTVLQVR